MSEVTKLLDRPPITIGEFIFRCYRDDSFTPYWKSDNGRCRVLSNFGKSTYTAATDGRMIGRLYRSKESAMQAAVAASYPPPDDR